MLTQLAASIKVQIWCWSNCQTGGLQTRVHRAAGDVTLTTSVIFYSLSLRLWAELNDRKRGLRVNIEEAGAYQQTNMSLWTLAKQRKTRLLPLCCLLLLLQNKTRLRETVWGQCEDKTIIINVTFLSFCCSAAAFTSWLFFFRKWRNSSLELKMYLKQSYFCGCCVRVSTHSWHQQITADLQFNITHSSLLFGQ